MLIAHDKEICDSLQPCQLDNKKMTKQAHALTKDEFKRLLKIVSTTKYAKRDTLMVLMSFGLGLRAVELNGLKLQDVLDDNCNVRESVMLIRTKGNKKRMMYIVDNRIKKALTEYIEERKQRAFKKRNRSIFSLSQPLFLTQVNTQFSVTALHKRFEHIYKLAAIKGASSHSGRRTFATNLIEKGMDIKAVSILMGHSNIQSTAMYVQENPERLKRITMDALY